MFQTTQTRILLGIAGLFALGTVSAFAGEARHLTHATFESGSHMAAATTVAGAHADSRSDSVGVEAQANIAATSKEADRDDYAGGKTTVKNNQDTHGDEVSAVARNHAVVGGSHRNHGGAVSAVARMHTRADDDASMSAVGAELALRSR